MADRSEVVNYTPNGREIRRETRGGKEVYAVQSPRDNWWATGRTIRAAMLSAGWSRRLVDRDYAGAEDM